MRHRRIVGLVAGLVLLISACTAGAAPTTTTTTTPVTTTTQPGGRVILIVNGPAVIHEGDKGPFVEALQFYLVCTGHGQPSSEGSQVTVDGSFGPITADAVAYYQAELRRIPTGDPDEETFASLARDCRDDRTITFPENATTTDIAGNTAPGDEEVFVIDGRDGQVLGLQAIEGLVVISVVGVDGTVLESNNAAGPFEAEITKAQKYRVQISAAAETSFRITVTTRSPNIVASEFGPMKLAPAGLSIADIGDDVENTIAVITLVLDLPFVDTGWQSGVPGCSGSNRHLTWIIQKADSGESHPAVLQVDFADLGGTPFFAQYAYRSFDLTQLDPIAQGLATAEGFTIGSSLETFEDEYGDADFFDELRGLTDFNERMLAGFELGETAAERRAWYVGAGDDGCEDFG
ncbi:MAG: peptidoglycan-binding protein [Acidobacteria bacterium]|nr:peptidoglycan-binding protein [Acidobacteriota bacterium]